MNARGQDSPRTGLRRTEEHASWQDVCRQLAVEINQHEETGAER